MADRRQPAAEGELLDRSRKLSFTFDGRKVQAFEGDTVGSALHAAGVDTLSRSFKYHRPRGLLCGDGRCPNCLVNIDGVPNVRACTEPAREGMQVKHQNAWPSLKYDAMAMNGRFDFLLPVGFYYKTFIRPRRAWPYYEKVLRRLAGLGKIDPQARPHTAYRKRSVYCDVLVVGAGPAGCGAALEAAGRGAKTVLLDSQVRAGGHLQVSTAAAGLEDVLASGSGIATAAKLQALVAASPNIEHFSSTTAFGMYEDHLVAAVQGETMLRIRAKQIIIATGAAERPAVFENNDLPGVMLATGALRLARLYGTRPGTRAVVVTDDDHGLEAATELTAAGVGVTAVIDARPTSGSAPVGAELLTSARIVKASGRGHVGSVTVEVDGARREIGCDLVAVATRLEPVTQLLAQDGARPEYSAAAGEFVPAALPAGLIAAGDIRGFRHAALAYDDGRLAGAEAAATLGFGPAPDGRDEWRVRWQAARDGHRVLETITMPPGKKQFVCVCEDVTVKDLKQAIGEGYAGIELLKRYSTVTMGPCQGKMCQGNAARLHALIAGEPTAQTGLTTARPPYTPVALGALAGPHRSPVRRTGMHYRHDALKPTWMDMGEWKRPLVYTTIDHETRAVHEAVGLIDVSTLGKLDIKGTDAGAFLDWLHPNRFSDLKVGRVRYRAMLDDAGIIIDDGTVARLGEKHFIISTTTGNIEAVDQWLKWWLTSGDRDVTVTNVTSEYAAVNLAGPKARDVLAKLTSLDVSKEAMPYLAAAQGDVAGVPALILRIGFVGELGYEMHFPADYADYLWDALMDAGREFGIVPFGVEAQRVLRLEKQHAIVGQDTDALSQPYEAGMGWIVKPDKDDFVGRDAVAVFKAQGEQQALVGFEIAGHTVPAEGEAIVNGDEIAGRVTSSKYSPYLGKTIGLGWVPVADAADGRTITIRSKGALVTATVRTKPFYDPEGLRLRM